MQELAHGCSFFIHLQESVHVFSPPSKSILASKATTRYWLLKSSIFKSALEVPETQALKKRVSNSSQTLASSKKTWICAFSSSSSSSSLCFLFIYLFIFYPYKSMVPDLKKRGTSKTGHSSQNRTVRPRFIRVLAFFPQSGSWS